MFARSADKAALLPEQTLSKWLRSDRTASLLEHDAWERSADGTAARPERLRCVHERSVGKLDGAPDATAHCKHKKSVPSEATPEQPFKSITNTGLRSWYVKSPAWQHNVQTQYGYNNDIERNMMYECL